MSRKVKQNYKKYFKKTIQALLLILILFNIIYMTMCLSNEILPLQYIVKGNKETLETNKLNYDLSIMKSDMSTLKDIELEEVFKKFNIKNYSTFNIQNGLVIKDQDNHFKAKIVTVKDNMNVLNTNDFKDEYVNINKETAEFKNLKNGDKLILKLDELNEKEYKVNTDFTLKHPRLVYDVALFVKDNDEKDLVKDSKQANVIYLNIDIKDGENKESKLQEITDDIVKNNEKTKGLLIYKNPYEKVEKGLEYITKRFGVYYAFTVFLHIVLVSIYYILEPADKEIKKTKNKLALQIAGRVLIYSWLIYMVVLMPNIIVEMYKNTISYLGIYASYKFIVNVLVSSLIFNILISELIAKLMKNIVREKRQNIDINKDNIIIETNDEELDEN